MAMTEGLPMLPPKEQPPRMGEEGFALYTALEGVAEAVRYRDLVEKMMFNSVHAARVAGATWEQLGAVLGISHQGARSTWQRKLKALQNGSSR